MSSSALVVPVLQVTVHTSKHEGAGTDSAVFVTLHGSPGAPVTSASNSSSNISSSTGMLSSLQLQQQVETHAAGHGAAAAAAAGWRSSGRHELRGSRAAGLAAGSVASFTLPSMRSLGQLRQLTLELESMTVS
jgi:hypothetical protein